jgi:hypothetical protein
VAESGSQEGQQEQQSSGNGSEARKTALRAAAIAAASGATAIAARKAFSSGGSQQSGGSTRSRSSGDSSGNGGGESLMSGMVGTGLNAAKDSLLPFAEDAAHAAGEFLGANGPDFVRDTIVPAFIEGFQSAQSSGDE